MGALLTGWVGGPLIGSLYAAKLSWGPICWSGGDGQTGLELFLVGTPPAKGH